MNINWNIDKVPVRIGTAAIAVCIMVQNSRKNISNTGIINLETTDKTDLALENKVLLLDLANLYNFKKIKVTINNCIDFKSYEEMDKNSFDTFKKFKSITINDKKIHSSIIFLNYVGEKGSQSSKQAHFSAKRIALGTGMKTVLFNSSVVRRSSNIIDIYDSKHLRRKVNFRHILSLIAKSHYFTGEANGIGVLGILLSNNCVVYKPLKLHPIKMFFELKFSNKVPISFNSGKQQKIIRSRVDWTSLDCLLKNFPSEYA